MEKKTPEELMAEVVEPLTLEDHLEESKKEFDYDYPLSLYAEDFTKELWMFIDAKIKQAWTGGKIEGDYR
jgi:hypothetical protein